MLTIHSARRSTGFCDRHSRRDFLRIGGLTMGGLTLPQLLRAESESATQSRKAVIIVYLPGGPPHQDMLDLKPDAPLEVRGEFQPISTNVPGIEISELMPRLAGMMDKFVPIRSVVGSMGDHASFQCLSGRSDRLQPPGGWPEFGSIVAKLQGPTQVSVPPFVALAPKMRHLPYNSGKPGYLGPAFSPFQPNDDGKEDLVLQGVTMERLSDRQQLNRALDRLKSNLDRSGTMDGLDAFQRQALGMLTSNRVAAALDISKESPATLARYGVNTVNPPQGDAVLGLADQFLIARRLIEAGVRCVTLGFSFWDFHEQTFKRSRAAVPLFDKAITSLVSDLHQRGLDKDVTVCAWGEFGRTPVINRFAGRDHWPNVSCALLAGGGMRTGQVIGSTDRQAAEAEDRPVHFQEVMATLHNRLGIDANRTTLPDLTGRPRYLVDRYEPMRELI